MGYLALYINDKDLPEALPKLRKAGFHIEAKKSFETMTSSELISMGYTTRQLHYLRKTYKEEIVVSCERAKDESMKNIIYNYTEMQRLGLTPTTRKKSQTT